VNNRCADVKLRAPTVRIHSWNAVSGAMPNSLQTP
jgi:hypothetical protein